jgi:nickel transport protein
MKKVYDIWFFLLILLLASIITLSADLTVFGHKVTIFAWVDGDTVFTESKFSGGKKAINAQVLVFDRDGKRLLEGKTDRKGEFSFKVPKITDLSIVLNAGMGHRAEWMIPESEIREASGLLETKESTGSSQPVTVGLSKEEITHLIERSLDKKLGPIIRMISESQTKGPSVTEIVGGIGYIFGLMGVALYFFSRGKKKNTEKHND